MEVSAWRGDTGEHGDDSCRVHGRRPSSFPCQRQESLEGEVSSSRQVMTSGVCAAPYACGVPSGTSFRDLTRTRTGLHTATTLGPDQGRRCELLAGAALHRHGAPAG